MGVCLFQPENEATVYIEQNSKLADVIFPVPPIVVSLRDFDDVARAQGRKPIQGYPLVCVSVSKCSFGKEKCHISQVCCGC